MAVRFAWRIFSMLIGKRSGIIPSEITSREVFENRRDFIKTASAKNAKRGSQNERRQPDENVGKMGHSTKKDQQKIGRESNFGRFFLKKHQSEQQNEQRREKIGHQLANVPRQRGENAEARHRDQK